MNKDQIKDPVEDVKGKLKEDPEVHLDDGDLEIEGTVQKNTGKVPPGVGDLKEEINKDD